MSKSEADIHMYVMKAHELMGVWRGLTEKSLRKREFGLSSPFTYRCPIIREPHPSLHGSFIFLFLLTNSVIKSAWKAR